MKLDRCAGALAVLVTFSLMGCGTRASKTVACPSSPTVSTTQLMAADVRFTDDTPKVGKSQHSVAPASDVDEKSDDKDGVHRRSDARPGGGFSGYK